MICEAVGEERIGGKRIQCEYITLTMDCTEVCEKEKAEETS